MGRKKVFLELLRIFADVSCFLEGFFVCFNVLAEKELLKGLEGWLG